METYEQEDQQLTRSSMTLNARDLINEDMIDAYQVLFNAFKEGRIDYSEYEREQAERIMKSDYESFAFQATRSARFDIRETLDNAMMAYLNRIYSRAN